MTTIAFQAFVALNDNQPKKAREILRKFFAENFYPNTLELAENFLKTKPLQEHVEGYLDTLFGDDQKWLESVEIE